MAIIPVSRVAGPLADEFLKQKTPDLGPLVDLPGTWTGTGFNLISRPNRDNGKGFFLQIGGTLETLEFTRIGGDIPNRGSNQPDIFLHGLHYLQKVADCKTHGALHVEPGIWLFVPATTDPNVPNSTVVRHATIPHGDSLLAAGTFIATTTPVINPVFSTPFTDDVIPPLNAPAKEPLGSPYTDQLTQPDSSQVPKCCLPDGLSLIDAVSDPTKVLQAQIKDQLADKSITQTIVLAISTALPAGGLPLSAGILNIPFVIRNANAVQLDAIFWIETVQPPGAPPEADKFMQLQYVQRVILDFLTAPNGKPIHWPHISVATLVKQ